MNELMSFDYNNKKVRTVEKNGEFWWVLKDVCEVLSLTNATMIADRLDDDERSKFNLGRQGQVNIINESGLYNVILRSDKPEAKPFKKWVTSEVLPSIRKHGAYMTSDKIEEILSNPDTIIKLATDLKSEREQRQLLQTQNIVLEQKVAEYEPKAQYVDIILQSKSTLTITQIAADYGLTAYKLNKILHEEHIQRNVGGQWILYKEHMNLGYTRSETIHFVHNDGRPDTKLNTKWTQKGRLLIHTLLENRGIHANMDRRRVLTERE